MSLSIERSHLQTGQVGGITKCIRTAPLQPLTDDPLFELGSEPLNRVHPEDTVIKRRQEQSFIHSWPSS